MVTSSLPCSIGKNTKQESQALYSNSLLFFNSPITTVQAPQSPSAQPSFTPLRMELLRR